MKYQNPVIPGFYPDPSVCHANEDYYLVTSSFEYFPGVPVFHSKDLIHWKQIGNCLTRKSQLGLEGRQCSKGIYAPTIRYYEGTFYMITTDRFGKGNFYVTTKDPAGEWSEPIWIDTPMFDPSLFFDNDGKVYYTRRADTYDAGIVQGEIDIKTGKLLTPMKQILTKGFCSPDVEGPHLYKIGGYYYIMCAEGGSWQGHMETMGRSQNPYGPFEPCPYNPIVTNRHLPGSALKSTGHADLVESHDGSWWMVCHGTRHPNILGRETCLCPVKWTKDGWPIVNGNGTVPVEIESDCIEWHPDIPNTAREYFITEKLPCHWNFLRTPRDGDWSLTEKPGYLRLKGSSITLNDLDSPAFVGRRITGYNFTASTYMEFLPQSPNEEAGMTLILNNKYHIDMAISKEVDMNCIFVKAKIEGLDMPIATKRIKPGYVELRIFVKNDQFIFSYTYEDSETVELAKAPIKFLSNEFGNGWTGAYAGMYATGNGIHAKVPADFYWFEYTD